ncbi:MAG TPA: hypothetical protein VKZ53_28635 [Candidatus Angelobacter sp.]|nr:hypothetical protein [Candidatus Angelobacter sp.]
MKIQKKIEKIAVNYCKTKAVCAGITLLLVLASSGSMVAQSRVRANRTKPDTAAVENQSAKRAGEGTMDPDSQASASSKPTDATNEEQIGEDREQLYKLLRLSPKLTSVVARDPAILSQEDYVTRNNPELAAFLKTHPQVARNPDFYLFSTAVRSRGRGDREAGLQRVVWPEFSYPEDFYEESRLQSVLLFLGFASVLGAVLWLLHRLMENKRWVRIMKVRDEVHNKLLDRFATNEQLLQYMNTDAGRRFLEAAPPGSIGQPGMGVGQSLVRVVVPVQLGIILVLLGTGLLSLRHNIGHAAEAFLIVGTLSLVLGFGFVLSGGIAFGVARHLGLVPPKAENSREGRMNLDAHA